MTRSFIVLAAGGHAKVVVNLLQLQGSAILGVADSDPMLHGSVLLGVPVHGGDDWVLKHAPDLALLANGLGSISDSGARARLFLKMVEHGYEFPYLVHPLAIIAPGVVIGAGSQVMAGAIIQPGVRIGQNTIVNTGAVIDHDCVIGDHVHVAPGVTLSGNVHLNEGVHVGTGATLVQGISVGRRTVIGAGAVVLENLAEGKTAVGVPARPR